MDKRILNSIAILLILINIGLLVILACNLTGCTAFGFLTSSPDNLTTEHDSPAKVSISDTTTKHSAGNIIIRIARIQPDTTVYCTSPNPNITYNTRTKNITTDQSPELYATHIGGLMVASNVTTGTKIHCYAYQESRNATRIASYIAGDVTFV